MIARIAAALSLLAFAVTAAATTTTIDYGDLWYNAPAESQGGWGVNVAQQGEVLFVTLFVYGQDSRPHWYVASSVASTSPNAFSGQLFDVGSGTYFGAPWTGIAGVRAVGNIAFTFDSSTTGSMTYTVDGVQVTKGIVRQSWGADVLSGTYVGAVTGQGPTCGGSHVRIPGALIVTHTPPSIAMTLDFNVSATQNGRCSYQGTYAQVGSVGRITGGAYHCDVNGVVNAVTGTFTVDEIRATRNGFSGKLAVLSPQCNYNGYIGGIKDQFP
jgi:hypothetical protein